MSRYWQSAETGEITKKRPPFRIETYWTEVRVVPLDAIVIERSRVPLVTVIDGNPRADAENRGATFGPSHIARPGMDPDAVEAQGLAQLALAEYLRAHPPIDEAQVEALTAALNESTNVTVEVNRATAVRLIRAGWSK